MWDAERSRSIDFGTLSCSLSGAEASFLLILKFPILNGNYISDGTKRGCNFPPAAKKWISLTKTQKIFQRTDASRHCEEERRSNLDGVL